MFRLFIALLALYGFTSLMILWWFWKSLKASPKLRAVLVPTLGVLSFCFMIFYKSTGNSFIEIFLLYAGSICMGGILYILIMIILSETGLFLWQKTKGVFSAERMMQIRYKISLAILIITVLIGITGTFIASTPVLKQMELNIKVTESELEKLAQKTLSFALVSDVHLGRMISAQRLANTLALLKPHQPETIFFAGDILDDHVRIDPAPVKQMLDELNPKYGSWVIPGNHEYISGHIDKSLEILQKNGMTVLRDQWAVLNDSVLLVGRDDLSKFRFTGTYRSSLEGILELVPEKFRNLPMIVLDHQPYGLDQAHKAGASLQLSGHTHNGQVWPINLIVKAMYENPYGLSRKGDTHYYVSLGAGNWGPPIRNTGSPEIVMFKLNFVAR